MLFCEAALAVQLLCIQRLDVKSEGPTFTRHEDLLVERKLLAVNKQQLSVEKEILFIKRQILVNEQESGFVTCSTKPFFNEDGESYTLKECALLFYGAEKVAELERLADFF